MKTGLLASIRVFLQQMCHKSIIETNIEGKQCRGK